MWLKNRNVAGGERIQGNHPGRAGADASEGGLIMLVGLKEILGRAQEEGFAIPAFNVYNMETVMGVIQAAEEKRLR